MRTFPNQLPAASDTPAVSHPLPEVLHNIDFYKMVPDNPDLPLPMPGGVNSSPVPIKIHSASCMASSIFLFMLLSSFLFLLHCRILSCLTFLIFSSFFITVFIRGIFSTVHQNIPALLAFTKLSISYFHLLLSFCQPQTSFPLLSCFSIFLLSPFPLFSKFQDSLSAFPHLFSLLFSAIYDKLNLSFVSGQNTRLDNYHIEEGAFL